MIRPEYRGASLHRGYRYPSDAIVPLFASLWWRHLCLADVYMNSLSQGLYLHLNITFVFPDYLIYQSIIIENELADRCHC